MVVLKNLFFAAAVSVSLGISSNVCADINNKWLWEIDGQNYDVKTVIVDFIEELKERSVVPLHEELLQWLDKCVKVTHSHSFYSAFSDATQFKYYFCWYELPRIARIIVDDSTSLEIKIFALLQYKVEHKKAALEAYIKAFQRDYHQREEEDQLLNKKKILQFMGRCAIGYMLYRLGHKAYECALEHHADAVQCHDEQLLEKVKQMISEATSRKKWFWQV